jgi:hypothetical protein
MLPIRGQTKDVSDEVKKLTDSMTQKQLIDFAKKQEMKEMVKEVINNYIP